MIRRTAFDGPLLLFLLSAALGAWLAYDQAAAWSKFLLVVGGIVLFWGISRAPEHIREGNGGRHFLVRLPLLLLPPAIAVYFLITHDWQSEMGIPSWLDPLRLWLGVWRLEALGYRLHPNQVGGIIAAFIPLQIAALSAGKKSHALSWVAALLLCLSAIGLLMSATRGAWLALAVAMTGWALWLLSERLTRPGQAEQSTCRWCKFWVIVPAVAGVVVYLALVITPFAARLGEIDSGRLSLWRNSLHLVSDYPFSGLGLASFEMPYSSYALLLHVGFLSHAHNLLLDVWLEQGLLGLAAIAWLFVAAALQNQPVSYWWKPALASLAVILLHGLVDDAFYGYDAIGILLLFVPFALLAGPSDMSGQTERLAATSEKSSLRLPVSFVVLTLVLLAIIALLFLPSWHAALQSNLGALAQTRAELAVYRWPDWPAQDALRRSSEIDLTPALARYRAALAKNPADVTANRRLGQIELSVGEYESARGHLEAAYAVAPDQRATRQLLGESYAVTGDVEQAAALWRTVDTSQGQLDIRQWWYEYIDEPQRAARIAEGRSNSDIR